MAIAIPPQISDPARAYWLVITSGDVGIYCYSTPPRHGKVKRDRSIVVLLPSDNLGTANS